MNDDQRRASQLRNALSRCIADAGALDTTNENARAIQRLVAFLWAAQDTLDQVSPERSLAPSADAVGAIQSSR